MEIKAVTDGFLPPSRSHEGDLPGYKPKPKLEPAPYVKEKATGFIWFWQPWMISLGDVLESCWEAPPARKPMVATGYETNLYGHPPVSDMTKSDLPRVDVQQQQAVPVTPTVVKGRRKSAPKE